MNLITDRSKDHVDYLKKLNAKGWTRMNPTERAEWSGDPQLSRYLLDCDSPVNLFSGSYYSGSTARVETDGETFVVKPSQPNLSQTYMRFSLGDADYLIGQTVTLSFGSVAWEGDIAPVLSFRWSDSSTNIAKLELTQSNSITFDCPIIVSSGVKLYAFLYFTSGVTIAPDDAVVTLNKAMFEFGSVAHDYVPYQPVLNTYARRGAYNFTDLNRVETAVAKIAGLLGLTLTTKTDWGLWDIPTKTEMTRYLSNVVAIRDACPVEVEFPTLPDTMAKMNYESANNIERTLELVYGILTGSGGKLGTGILGSMILGES